MSECIESRKFKLIVEEYDDCYIAYLLPLPAVGRGKSPLDALNALTEALPSIYEQWGKSLDFVHMQDSKALESYKELTYFTKNFQDDSEGATYYLPV